MNPIPVYPWKDDRLSGWSIVGMNHYTLPVEGRGHVQCLFVAMTKGEQTIKAEGRDDESVWEELRARAIIARFPKPFSMTFDPATCGDELVMNIFKDEFGGLIWCALRQNRLVSQNFNSDVAQFVNALRYSTVRQYDESASYYRPYMHHLRDVFGSNESPGDWAKVIGIIANPSNRFKYEIKAHHDVKKLMVNE